MARERSFHPIVELTLARLRELVREPEALFWAFLFPIIMSVAMAAAFPSTSARPVVVGLLPGPDAAAVQRALGARAGLLVRPIDASSELRALREGEVDLVVLPATPPVYRFDASRDESRAARLVVDDALKRASGRADPWTATEQPVQIPGSRYVDWLIPGLIAMGVMATSVWGIAISIVQARMRKLLKRLVASPMRKSQYLLAQVLARMLFLVPEVAVPLAFGALVLGMPVRGSLFAIMVVAAVGALSWGGIGLLLGSRPKTFEAISGLANLVTLPMWIAGGIFFSSTRFPQAVQPFVQALPMNALVNALRAVVLEGVPLQSLGRELTVMAVWGVIPFAIALKIFRWR